jgi:hypothetical protein
MFQRCVLPPLPWWCKQYTSMEHWSASTRLLSTILLSSSLSHVYQSAFFVAHEDSHLSILNLEHDSIWKLNLHSVLKLKPWRRLGEGRYSSYSFLTSVLDGGEWSASRPGHTLAPGKGPLYPLYRRLGGPQSRSGHRGYRKNPFASARDRTSIARSSSP